jgi:hypothetical protein
LSGSPDIFPACTDDRAWTSSALTLVLVLALVLMLALVLVLPLKLAGTVLLLLRLAICTTTPLSQLRQLILGCPVARSLTMRPLFGAP